MSELDLMYDSANQALCFSKIGVLEEKGTTFVVYDPTDGFTATWSIACVVRKGNGSGPVGVIFYKHTYRLHTFIVPDSTIAVINSRPDSTLWDIVGLQPYVVTQLQAVTVYGLAGNVNFKQGSSTSHSPLSDCQFKQFMDLTLNSVS